MPARRIIMYPQGAGSLRIQNLSPLPSGTVGTAYSDLFTGAGGVPPYTWSVLEISGTNSWSFSGANLIGTPTSAETDILNIKLQDSVGNTVSGSFTITIQAASTTAGPLGLNLGGAENYYNPEQPFINLMKNGGSNSSYNMWFTTTGSGDTGQEYILQQYLDSDGYPTTLTGAGLNSGTQVYCLINNHLDTAGLPPGISVPYPAGSYTLQFQGAGTIVFGGDVSSGSLSSSSPNVSVSGLTITSTQASGITATVTFNIPTPTSGGFSFYITATDPSSVGNYIKAIAIVLTSNMTAYTGGALFNPTWISLLQQANIPCIRFMDWMNTNGQLYASDGTDTPYLSAVPNSGDTSATFATAWALPTNTNWTITLANGQTITNCTCTYGSTAVTFGQAVNSNPFATFYYTYPSSISHQPTTIFVNAIQNFADRPKQSNCFWSTRKGVPLEVCFQLCNQLGVNPWICIPYGSSSSYWTSVAQLAYNGTGTSVSGFTGVNSGLKLYVEYGNEHWNTASPEVNGYVYLAFQGCTQFYSNSGAPQYTGANNCEQQWFGVVTAQIGSAFSAVYGASFGSRCVVSMGGQAANTGVVAAALSASYWVAQGNTAPYLSGFINGVHIAPYFGAELQAADYTYLSSQGDGGYTAFFAAMTATNSNLTSSNWLNTGSAANGVSNHVTAMASYGHLPVFCYESGQTFYGANQNANNFLTTANRDARMGTAYTTYYQNQISQGATAPINVFDSCYYGGANGTYNGYNWGLVENTLQYSATLANEPPKFQAVVGING